MKIHFSIDDVIKSLLWLQENNASSIFESHTFDLARWFYEKYGMITTCNCLYSDGNNCLKDISDKWKKEFEINSKWLKFAFHGYDFEKNYKFCEYDDAASDYILVRDEVLRICGKLSFTNWTRIHFFSGSGEAVKAWRDNGLKGLFTADDTRGSYDLLEDEEQSILGIYKRKKDCVSFAKTDIRLEWYSERELAEILKNKHEKQLVFFTHENLVPMSETRVKIDLIMSYFGEDAIENFKL